MTIIPHLSPLPFDPLKEFTPIAGIATTDVAFCIGNHVPASNLREFVDYAKKKATPITLGSAGAGTITHLLVVRLAEAAGMPFVHVAYKGIVPALQDVMGGHIDGSACAAVVSKPLGEAGKIKVVGMFGTKRSKALPSVPTTIEEGYPVPDDSWYGIFGPANLPNPLARTMFDAFKDIASDPAVAADLAKQGFDMWIKDPAALTQMMRDESVKWSQFIRANNIKSE
jgi:tripartite-type tricarboxylate transporter receptor subunit TctC